MQKAKSCFKLQPFTTIRPRRNNRKADNAALSTLQRRLKLGQELFANFTVVIFTGSLFLGGSYLFFVKLAEFGW